MTTAEPMPAPQNSSSRPAAEARTAADADHLRARHRIACQSLQKSTRHREKTASGHGGQQPGPAERQQALQIVRLQHFPAIRSLANGECGRHQHRHDGQCRQQGRKPASCRKLDAFTALHVCRPDFRQEPQKQRTADQGRHRSRWKNFRRRACQKLDQTIAEP